VIAFAFLAAGAQYASQIATAFTVEYAGDERLAQQNAAPLTMMMREAPLCLCGTDLASRVKSS
jgi:hypothetical protein